MHVFLGLFSIGYAKQILYCLDSGFGLSLCTIRLTDSVLLLSYSSEFKLFYPAQKKPAVLSYFSNLQYLHQQYLHQRNCPDYHKINT